MLQLDLEIEADWPSPPDWEELAKRAAAAICSYAPTTAVVTGW